MVDNLVTACLYKQVQQSYIVATNAVLVSKSECFVAQHGMNVPSLDKRDAILPKVFELKYLHFNNFGIIASSKNLNESIRTLCAVPSVLVESWTKKLNY